MEKKIQEKIKLFASTRNLVGKKAKKLRKQGLILGNIYGVNFKSKSISINSKDFFKVYRVAKETKIIYLNIDKEEIPVLIKNIQTHPITNEVLHVDFRKVDLKKKIQTEIPIKIVGQSEAVDQKGGVLLTQSQLILIEALPENIPEEIEVDISFLKEIGQDIKVSDLIKSEKYEIKSPKDKVIVSVIAHKEESIAPEVRTTTPEVITEVKTKEKQEKPEEKTKSIDNNQKNKNLIK